MSDKKIKAEGIIQETARLFETELGKYCDIGAYTTMQNVNFGDYSYCCSNCIFLVVNFKINFYGVAQL